MPRVRGAGPRGPIVQKDHATSVRSTRALGHAPCNFVFMMTFRAAKAVNQRDYAYAGKEENGEIAEKPIPNLPSRSVNWQLRGTVENSERKTVSENLMTFRSIVSKVVAPNDHCPLSESDGCRDGRHADD